jgi:cyclic pyranopterin phosphate synthase
VWRLARDSGAAAGARTLRAPYISGVTSLRPLLRDAFARPLGSVRVSVTDRCNLRCRYCMPEDEYVWLPRESILSFEEIDRVVGIFTGLGASKVRLTGGEPLLRHDLATLVRFLARNGRIRDLALTTNGVLLAERAVELRAAGLRRVTVSLDTLRPDRFRAFTRSTRHADVLSGIDAARAAGFGQLKLNTVVIRGYNDDELLELIEFGRRHDAEVRFIEYMDVGGATLWSPDQVVSRREILEVVARRYGGVEPVLAGEAADASAPAERFAVPDGTTFGVIASTTAPFCRDCDRSRLTADGTWLLCLYAERGVDLRTPLRAGASDEEIAELIARVWRARTDRGAELRAATPARGALYQLQMLRDDPHREMHTRGG